jgi:hypothetical protein
MTRRIGKQVQRDVTRSKLTRNTVAILSTESQMASTSFSGILWDEDEDDNCKLIPLLLVALSSCDDVPK